jgi:hypothetical protein
MDKAGQNWTRLAKIGQPVDNFSSPSVVPRTAQRGVKEKTPALFLAVLRG